MTKISGSDTTKGYYHIELDYESSLLCTFITPYGRFRPTRLPFGVKVSQDVFQRKLDEILKDVPNVTGIADDILVYGRTDTEHDLAFINMLETCREKNVGLNSEKLQFKKDKVKFFGHTLTPQGLQPAEDKLKAIQDIKTPNNFYRITHCTRNDQLPQQIFSETSRIHSTPEEVNKEGNTLQVGGTPPGSTRQNQRRTQ